MQRKLNVCYKVGRLKTADMSKVIYVYYSVYESERIATASIFFPHHVSSNGNGNSLILIPSCSLPKLHSELKSIW